MTRAFVMFSRVERNVQHNVLPGSGETIAVPLSHRARNIVTLTLCCTRTQYQCLLLNSMNLKWWLIHIIYSGFFSKTLPMYICNIFNYDFGKNIVNYIITYIPYNIHHYIHYHEIMCFTFYWTYFIKWYFMIIITFNSCVIHLKSNYSIYGNYNFFFFFSFLILLQSMETDWKWCRARMTVCVVYTIM